LLIAGGRDDYLRYQLHELGLDLTGNFNASHRKTFLRVRW